MMLSYINYMFPYEYNPESIIDRIMMKRWAFLGTFFIVFFLSYLFLVAVDFVPDPPKPLPVTDYKTEPVNTIEHGASFLTTVTDANSLVSVDSPEKPESIYISALDKEIKVLNPVSRDVADLDESLLSGAVRHPDSALFGQDGNVFILGHSSYLPQIYNKNFQVFNGIQDLEWGDTIEVTTDTKVYVYRVDKVYKATADDATVIPIAGDDRRLTLATCNSFGKVEDRFIVEAVEISERPR